MGPKPNVKMRIVTLLKMAFCILGCTIPNFSAIDSAGAQTNLPATAVLEKPFEISNSSVMALSKISGPSIVANGELKQVLLYFWATWCPDCKEKLKKHLPEFQTATKATVFAISTDRDQEKVLQFLQNSDIQISTFLDPEKVVRGPLKIIAVPSWALIERRDSATWVVKGRGTATDLSQIYLAAGHKYGERK